MGDLGMVFQKYALFTWKTVMGNVEMSQKLKGVEHGLVEIHPAGGLYAYQSFRRVGAF